MLRRDFLALMLALGLPLPAAADAPPGFFDQSLGDFKEELAAAKDAGKRGIMLFFEMDECPFCHRMKTMVFPDPRVREYFKKHFLMFPVDIEGDVQITTFEGQAMSMKDYAFKLNRVRATPVIAFYDLTGKQVAKFTGATNGVEEFLWLGEYVADGHYKTMPFAKYKQQKKSAA